METLKHRTYLEAIPNPCSAPRSCYSCAGATGGRISNGATRSDGNEAGEWTSSFKRQQTETLMTRKYDPNVGGTV